MPRISDVLHEIIHMLRDWRSRLRATADRGLLAAGAVVLMCAPVLPRLSRLVVLPALLLAPGFALLYLLGQPPARRSIAAAVPVSLVLVIIASLFLYLSGIPLGPVSLGLLLGALTAVFLVGSYARQRAASQGRHHETARPPGPAQPGTTFGERK